MLLGIDMKMLKQPRTNGYLTEFPSDPLFTSLFSKIICFASDHKEVPLSMDKPMKIESKYLTKQCQFLGLLLSRNAMPVRIERFIEPYALKIMEENFAGHVPINLPWFIKSTIYQCFKTNVRRHPKFMFYIILE